MTLEGRAVDEETEKGEATHALVVETEQLHLSTDRPEINWHDGDLCDETEGEGDEVEAEMCSSSIESLTQAEDQKYAVSLVLFVQPAHVMYIFYTLPTCHLLL